MTMTPNAAWIKSTRSTEAQACVEVRWTKSTHSGEYGNCVEIGWTKSAWSTHDGSNCVEVYAPAGTVLVRDSKNPDAGNLAFSPEAWTGFINDIKAGAFVASS